MPNCCATHTRSCAPRSEAIVPSPILFPQAVRPLRGLLQPLNAPAAGMALEQKFLEVIAANIANVETTHTPEGGPYKRQVAVADHDAASGQLVTRVVEDAQPGR